jgi:carbonic anhydrase
MSTATEFKQPNQAYVDSYGNKDSLAIPPARKLAIGTSPHESAIYKLLSLFEVTCMDARVNPSASLGLKEGDAHIIRNAGGVA